jgi:hypothetical protein
MEADEWASAHRMMLAVSTYCVARSSGGRSPVQEPLLALDPQVAYLYSLKVLRGRFKEGEDAISRSPEWAVRYARFVLKGRFRMAEKSISESPRWTYEYAEKVIGGRLPRAMHQKMASMLENRFARKYMESDLCRKPEKD